MTTIIAHPNTGEQAKALRAFMKALKIAFEEKAEEQPYDPEFVKKIEESRQQAKEGKVTRLEKEDFKTYLGL
jgi:hypothetical protein